VPQRWKRCQLLCRVVNTVLLCFECFHPNVQQYDRLDKLIAGLGRIAMAGKASTTTDKGTRSLAIRQVLQYWRIAPTAVEALIRRLRWIKNITRFPEYHRQLLTAFFGSLPLDGPALDAGGNLLDHTCPWAKRFLQDIYDVCSCVEGVQMVWEMAADTEGGLLLAMFEPGIAQELGRLDPTVLRRASWAVEVPPESAVKACADVEAEQEVLADG